MADVRVEAAELGGKIIQGKEETREAARLLS
jgi:hypothetical protein